MKNNSNVIEFPRKFKTNTKSKKLETDIQGLFIAYVELLIDVGEEIRLASEAIGRKNLCHDLFYNVEALISLSSMADCRGILADMKERLDIK